MNANELPEELRRKAAKLQQYAMYRFPREAGQKTLRFINLNFRAQGYAGNGYTAWKDNIRKTTILIRKGHLRRSIKSDPQPGQMRVYTDLPYSRVHNRGFNGTVNVRAHTRRSFEAIKVGTGRYTKSGNERMRTVHKETGNYTVAAHTRKMNIPKRQFMPETEADAQNLINSIRRDVVDFIKQLFP